MAELRISLERFRLSGSQLAKLQNDYRLLISNTGLSRSCEEINVVNKAYNKISGIYFWVVEYENARFSIYVGKTTSLAYRLKNYSGEFQPNAPNDYKMRVFAEFLSETFPKAKLQLYFCQTDNDKGVLREAENNAIRTFQPLLNPPSKRILDEARAAQRHVFSTHYRKRFENILLYGQIDD